MFSTPIEQELSSGRRLSEVAYDRILECLFDGKLPAGSFMSQSQLVDLLEIPVAPLRDALRVLEAEGVLVIHPRSGIEFVKPGLELTRSTYQFRTILEVAAVRVFADTASDDQIASLLAGHRDLIARIETGVLGHDEVRGLEALEADLHNSVIASLNNPLIDSSYRRMHNYLKLLRVERKLTSPLALRSLREHVEIIEACRDRDPGRAEAKLRAHFSSALQRNMGLY